MSFIPQKSLQTEEFPLELQEGIARVQLNLEKLRIKGETILGNSKTLHFLLELKELIIQNSLHSDRLQEQDQYCVDRECKENYLYLYFHDLIELAKTMHQNNLIPETEWFLKVAEEQSRFFAERAPLYLGVANLFARIYLLATVEDFVEQGTDELKETVRNSPNYHHPILWHILFTDYVQQKTELLVSHLEKTEQENIPINPQGIFSSLKQLKLSIPLFSLVK